MRFSILILLVLTSTFCSKTRGTFAFFSADQSQLNVNQQKWYQPRRCKKFKPPASFQQSKILWYFYTPGTTHFQKPYAMSLSQKSLGWVEVDLKNQELNSEGAIIDQFTGLEPGKYLLRIAYENEVIDRYEFEIVPDENKDTIDFSAAVTSTSDLEEVDDILLYSK